MYPDIAYGSSSKFDDLKGNRNYLILEARFGDYHLLELK